MIRSDTYKSITYIYNLDEFIMIHPTTFTNKVWSVLKEICFFFFEVNLLKNLFLRQMYLTLILVLQIVLDSTDFQVNSLNVTKLTWVGVTIP